MLQVGRCLLRDHLKRKKLTQLQLAEKLGVHEQMINKYVNDRTIMSLVTAKNIAYILDCSVDDLYIWERVSEPE